MTGIDFDCETCGEHHEEHDGTPASPWPLLEFPAPEAFLRMDPWDRILRTRLEETLCLIDNGRSTDAYVTAILRFPVRGEEAALLCAPWVHIDVDAFREALANFADPRYRETIPGTLATVLPGLEEPLGIPVRVQVTGGGLPPLISPDAHARARPLAHELRVGITRAEAELRLRSMMLDDPVL